MFAGFIFKLSNIFNLRFNLGEKILYSKVVMKILNSLPKRFKHKVIVIEENKNIDSMRVDETYRFLPTYEMSLLFSKVLGCNLQSFQ